MAAPVALPLVLLLLGMGPVAEAGGRGGAQLCTPTTRSAAASQPGTYHSGRRTVLYPDTARRPAVADTVRTRPAAVALVPDEDEKVTRKSALYIVAAIAVLTLTTLLLYNVRSR